MATLTACNDTAASNTDAADPHEASFSSYMRGSKGAAFVPQFAEPIHNLSPLIMSNQFLYLGRNKLMSRREIDVFGAEKYFGEGVEPRITLGAAACHPNKKDGDKAHLDPSGRRGIPLGNQSVSSASSYNSQSTLLQSGPRNSSRNKLSMARGRGFFSNLGCNCCCSSKRSVEVEPPVVDEKFNGKTTKEEPSKVGVKALEPTSRAGKFLQMEEEEEEEGEGREQKSLGGFGSPVLEQGNRIFSFDRRLNSFNWDPAHHQVEGNENQATSNDVESDASSDLFEIESFSSRLNPFLKRQASDGGSTSGCITPTTCYAPSEASIAWSVVTATTADCLALSDSEGRKRWAVFSKPDHGTKLDAATTPRNIGRQTQQQRRLPSSLLGCKSQKAVSVAGSTATATRANERPNSDPKACHMSESFRPVISNLI